MLAAKSVLKQSAQHSERISSFAVTALSNPALYPQARTAFVQLLVRVFMTHLFIHCDGSQGVHPKALWCSKECRGVGYYAPRELPENCQGWGK